MERSAADISEAVAPWVDGLPRGAGRDHRGVLTLGGVAADTIAAAYGTPALTIDTDVLDDNVARISRTAAEVGADVAYAGKALLFVALARRLAATSLFLDVCSMGELLTAERAAFPASRLVLHGCGKTDAELLAAARGRVGCVVVDGAEELERLTRIDAQQPVRVLLRGNSGIVASTHASVRTGGENSKFGFALSEAQGAIRRVIEAAHLRFAGVHTHLGSQIYDSEPILGGLAAVLDVAAQAAALGVPADAVVVGGGFGVAARPGASDRRDPTVPGGVARGRMPAARDGDPAARDRARASDRRKRRHQRLPRRRREAARQPPVPDRRRRRRRQSAARPLPGLPSPDPGLTRICGAARDRDHLRAFVRERRTRGCPVAGGHARRRPPRAVHRGRIHV